MDSDTWLKALALHHPQDLLRLVGDAHGTATSARILELQAIKRRVDCVIQVRQGDTTYFRHVEFQAEAEADMPGDASTFGGSSWCAFGRWRRRARCRAARRGYWRSSLS